MPEAPEVVKFMTHIGRAISKEFKLAGEAIGYLMIIPRCFAEGTATRSYGTCSIAFSDFSHSQEQKVPDYIPNEHDMSRSIGKPWQYLIDRPLVPGPVSTARRGKALVIAAGYVSFI